MASEQHLHLGTTAGLSRGRTHALGPNDTSDPRWCRALPGVRTTPVRTAARQDLQRLFEKNEAKYHASQVLGTSPKMSFAASILCQPARPRGRAPRTCSDPPTPRPLKVMPPGLGLYLRDEPWCTPKPIPQPQLFKVAPQSLWPPQGATSGAMELPAMMPSPDPGPAPDPNTP